MSIWSVILIFWQWLAYLDYRFCYLFYGYLLVQNFPVNFANYFCLLNTTHGYFWKKKSRRLPGIYKDIWSHIMFRLRRAYKKVHIEVSIYARLFFCEYFQNFMGTMCYSEVYKFYLRITFSFNHTLVFWSTSFLNSAWWPQYQKYINQVILSCTTLEYIVLPIFGVFFLPTFGDFF